MDKVLKIFMASPSNLTAERQTIKKIAANMNETVGKRMKLYLEVLSWEKSVHPDIGADGQDVINRQIDDCYDIFIGMIWDRVGTATDRAVSGTIEEYERAYRKYCSNPQVKVMMYFKNSPVPLDQIDLDQIEKVKAFKKRVSGDGVMYCAYGTMEEFSEAVRNHLFMVMLELSQSPEKPKCVEDYIINPAADRGATKQSVSLAIVRKNAVLVVRRSKKLRIGPGLWQLPGGKLEPGETPAQALQREIYEELGLTVPESELQLVTTVQTEALGETKPALLQMHLFYLRIDGKKPEFRLEDSIDSVKWLPFSEINDNRMEYLGDTPAYLKLVKRYQYAFLPMKALQNHVKLSPGTRFPKMLPGYSEETTQTLLTMLDLLGFVDEKAPQNAANPENAALISVLLNWCLTSGAIFEENGYSDWKTNKLLRNSGEEISHYQQTIFENHQSLSTLLSYKLAKVVSQRRVCDILLFAKHHGKTYILLRWDYFAEKYQIPAKGLEKFEAFGESSPEAEPRFVVKKRLSEDIASAFSYEKLGSFSTAHLSSGSIEYVKLARNYEIDLFLLKPAEQEVQRILSTLEAINKNAAVVMAHDNISRAVKKATSSFHWVSMDTLKQEKTLCAGKKVQGFAEIADYLGMEQLTQMAQSNAMDLTGCTNLQDFIG